MTLLLLPLIWNTFGDKRERALRNFLTVGYKLNGKQETGVNFKTSADYGLKLIMARADLG